MAYNDLRKGRYSQSGRAYFITAVTHKRKKLFTNIYLARKLIKTMRQLHQDGLIQSISWVVMPDHLHWLFLLGNEVKLSSIIKTVKARSAREINDYQNRTGTVWQKAYYDRAIRDNEDLRQLARYIVANPLRAGLVDRIEQYPHWDAVWL